MICPNCNQTTARLMVYQNGVKACARCLGMSESAGVKVDGTLTRNSDRIREQQLRHEGDLIAPHIFDKNTKSLKPNPDFIKRYPDRLPNFYSQKELESAGHSKAGEVFKKHKQAKEAHQRDQNRGVTYRRKPK